MIPYSLNSDVRKHVTVILVLLSVCITALLENLIALQFKSISDFLSNACSGKAFQLLISVAVPPFIVWYLLHILYSKVLWKFSCFQALHKIPDLNGVWNGHTVNSKNPNQNRNVKVTIKQDWNLILIRTDINNTGRESFCQCTIAAIDVTSGEAILKYAYKNMILGEKSYVGYNELQIKGKKIIGQYTTTKPSTGIFDICKV